MAVGTLSETLDNLYTSTWQNMKDTVRDQIFDATPFYAWMKAKNKLRPVSGGRFITEPLNYAKNDNISWIGKGGTVTLDDFEHLTIAKYDWKYQAASVVRFGVDDQQNRGKNQIISLMNSKLENTKNAIIDDMETLLFAVAAPGDEIDGLQHLVADDPTASATIGGIDQSVTGNAYWRNKSTNMTGVSFAAQGISKMNTMLNDTSNNLMSDRPDIIVSGQTPYEYYEEEALTAYRITSNKMADMGFESQMYKGLPMVWSPSCANTRMYFLNTNFITLVYDPMLFFDMTEWKSIPDQPNDKAAQIMFAGAFTVSRRRCQGVIYNIDTQ